MTIDLAKAETFVANIDLSGIPRPVVDQNTLQDAGVAFDAAKTQAQVVGSAVFSFAQGVDEDVRQAISDSALLAQLVANKRAAVESEPIAWFSEYSKVLQNVGWTLQEGGWADYSATGAAVEVNEKIVEVLTVVLGPAPAALAIITATIRALKGMNSDSSWITIFSRESQKAKIARFQIGLVEKAADGDVFVSLLACLVEAQNDITQVLFFKFRQSHASFKANNSKVSINRAALKALGPKIQARVLDYQEGYLSTVLDI